MKRVYELDVFVPQALRSTGPSASKDRSAEAEQTGRRFV